MIPAGYEWRTGSSGEGLAVKAAADWLQGVLDSGRTVHEWAAECEPVEELHGRGIVYVVEAPVSGPDRRSRWAVRHYHRGGAVAHLLGDRYLRRGPTRPELEVHASAVARERLVPTPAVVAGAWYPDGAFYRADLVTELLPDATSLADALFSPTGEGRSPELLSAAGRLVALAGRNGIVHADLNAKNVLFASEAEGHHAYLIDLDRAQVREAADSGTGVVMLNRLNRSLAKLGNEAGAPLTQEEIGALWDGFRE